MFFRMVYKSGPIFLPFCQGSRVWHTDRRTDGWTDRQTDRILIARPRLHFMQRGKNRSSGVIPSRAKEQTIMHRPLTFHPFVGLTPWTDWHAIWGGDSPTYPYQISCQSVKGSIGCSTPKSYISYTYSNNPYNNLPTVQTVISKWVAW